MVLKTKCQQTLLIHTLFLVFLGLPSPWCKSSGVDTRKTDNRTGLKTDNRTAGACTGGDKCAGNALISSHDQVENG